MVCPIQHTFQGLRKIFFFLPLLICFTTTDSFSCVRIISLKISCVFCSQLFCCIFRLFSFKNYLHDHLPGLDLALQTFIYFLLVTLSFCTEVIVSLLYLDLGRANGTVQSCQNSSSHCHIMESPLLPGTARLSAGSQPTGSTGITSSAGTWSRPEIRIQWGCASAGYAIFEKPVLVVLKQLDEVS